MPLVASRPETDWWLVCRVVSSHPVADWSLACRVVSEGRATFDMCERDRRLENNSSPTNTFLNASEFYPNREVRTAQYIIFTLFWLL